MKKEKIIDNFRYKKNIKKQNRKIIKKIENLICFNEQNELELKDIKEQVLRNSSLSAILLILASIIITIVSSAILINMLILSLSLLALNKIRIFSEEKRKIDALEKWVKRLTPNENEELEYLVEKLKFIKKDFNNENEYMYSLKCVSYREHVKIFETKSKLKKIEIIKGEKVLLKQKVNERNIIYIDDQKVINNTKNQQKIKSLN